MYLEFFNHPIIPHSRGDCKAVSRFFWKKIKETHPAEEGNGGFFEMPKKICNYFEKFTVFLLHS